MAQHTRPRPSSIDLLPDECEGIVAWAAQELANTGRSQTDIYAEFRQKLIALQGELGLGFDIPHFSSFNRHNMRLAKLNQRQRRVQMIADAYVESSDGQDADNMLKAATRLLKTLTFEMMEKGAEDGFNPKEASNAAAALHRISLAENVSTMRRQKLIAEVDRHVVEAVDQAAAAGGTGINKEQVLRIIREAYGVDG